jgi:hypothetical protein
MAQSKKITVKDIRAHLFMSIIGNSVELVYHDDYENGAGLGAALSSVLEEDKKLFDIFSAAFLTALEAKEKNSNWEKVKFPKKEKSISKTPKKVAKPQPIKKVAVKKK